MGSSGGVQFQEPLADNQWSTAFSHVEAIRAKGTTDNREASAVLFVVANNLEGRGSRRGKAAMPASYHCSPSGQVATGLAAGRTLYMATLPYKVIANRQGNFSAALTQSAGTLCNHQFGSCCNGSCGEKRKHAKESMNGKALLQVSESFEKTPKGDDEEARRGK